MSTQLPFSFLEIAILLQNQGHMRESLAVIYQSVEAYIQDGAIDDLNEKIANVNPDEMSTDIILGVLTATLPVKSKLVARKLLFKNTVPILVKRNHFEPRILDGLE